MRKSLRATPGLTDVKQRSADHRARSWISILSRDRASAASASRRGRSKKTVALQRFQERARFPTIFKPLNDYQVIMRAVAEVSGESQLPGPALYSISRPSIASSGRRRQGNADPAKLQITAVERDTVGPLVVNHFGQLPSMVTVLFDTAPGVSLGEAVNTPSWMKPRTAGRISRIPSAPSSRAPRLHFQSSLTGMGMLLVMAILVIYMVTSGSCMRASFTRSPFRRASALGVRRRPGHAC